MNRRQFIAASTGGLCSIAGCLSLGGEDAAGTGTGTPGTETRSATPTARRDDVTRVEFGQQAPVAGREVSLSEPRVRKAVFTYSQAHNQYLGAWKGQFVVVDVHVDGAPAEELEGFELHPSVEAVEDTRRGAEQGQFAVPFPVGEYESPTVVADDGDEQTHWVLPDATAERLAVEPRFSIQDSNLHWDGEAWTLELTVSNEGQRGGWFRATVTTMGVSGNGPLQFEVPAGESRTYSGTAGGYLEYFDDDDDGRLTIEYPASDGVEGTTVEFG